MAFDVFNAFMLRVRATVLFLLVHSLIYNASTARTRSHNVLEHL